MTHPLLQCSPFPLIDEDGNLVDGYLLQQAAFCKDKCKDRVCRGYSTQGDGGGAVYRTCPHEYSVITARLGKIVVTINGVVEATTTEASTQFKRAHRDVRKVKKPQIEAWLESLRRAEAAFDQLVDAAARDSISALHDVKAILGTLLRTAENWVWSQPGESIDDRLEGAQPELRTIYQSCRFLETLLRFTDIVANPAAAAYGVPTSKAVYKLVDLLVKVFEARAAARDLRLVLHGGSFNRPRIYDSFSVVPFVLLDNAVKYAERGSEIQVIVQDRPGGSVYVSVSSVGLPVPPNEQETIFSRGVRGSNVEGPGTGLGLFVARQVAAINHCVIQYEARQISPTTAQRFNIFSLLVSDVVA